MNITSRKDLAPRLKPTKSKITTVLLVTLVMFMPLLVALLLTAVRGYNLFQAIPSWNDEMWWYAQYAGISKYGMPLGFFGYAGTHSGWGTWGPWGMFPLLMTGLLSRIFGWGLHAAVYCNYFYLALSSLIFILLTKPKKRNLVMLAAANALMYITICYSVTAMNETVRYSMAIILAGIMYRLVTVPEVSKVRLILRCTVVPMLLMYATCFYVILGAFIPVYLVLMLRKWKPGWRVAAAAPVSAVAIILLKKLNGVTSCPYIPDQSAAATFVPTNFKDKLFEAFFKFLGNTQNIDPMNILAQANDGSAVLTWFCILLYVAMGFLIWRVHATARNPEKKTVFTVSLMSLWLLVAFWAGHIFLYNTTEWTFIRGCNTAVCCVMFLAALSPKEDRHVYRSMIIVCLLGAFTFLNVFCTVFARSDRFSTSADDALWAQQKQELADVIRLDRNADDPWANTVVLCGTDSSVYFALPDGVGINSPTDDGINNNARYVIVGHDFDDTSERNTDLQTLLNSGHKVIYEANTFTVLENCGRNYE